MLLVEDYRQEPIDDNLKLCMTVDELLVAGYQSTMHAHTIKFDYLPGNQIFTVNICPPPKKGGIEVGQWTHTGNYYQVNYRWSWLVVVHQS